MSFVGLRGVFSWRDKVHRAQCILVTSNHETVDFIFKDCVICSRVNQFMQDRESNFESTMDNSFVPYAGTLATRSERKSRNFETFQFEVSDGIRNCLCYTLLENSSLLSLFLDGRVCCLHMLFIVFFVMGSGATISL